MDESQILEAEKDRADRESAARDEAVETIYQGELYMLLRGKKGSLSMVEVGDEPVLEALISVFDEITKYGDTEIARRTMDVAESALETWLSEQADKIYDRRR